MTDVPSWSKRGIVGPDGLPPITLIRVGFWGPRDPDMPLLRDAPRLEGDQYVDDNTSILCQYLRFGSISYDDDCVAWDCMLCEEKGIGYLHFSDGVYEWLQGLDHYVGHHRVKLPQTFVNDALRNFHRISGARRDTSWWEANCRSTGWMT